MVKIHVISAPPPFSNDEETLVALERSPEVLRQISRSIDGVFGCGLEASYKTRGGRVYNSRKAFRELSMD